MVLKPKEVLQLEIATIQDAIYHLEHVVKLIEKMPSIPKGKVLDQVGNTMMQFIIFQENLKQGVKP